MQTARLKVEGLSKSYGGSAALTNVSFELNSHEALGYIGANGSGKSTTVKMLLGLTEPTSGKILLDGSDVRSNMIGWRRRLGYVPELPVIYPYLSAMEHLTLVGRLRSLPEPELQQKSKDLLDLLWLSDFREMPMSGYSKGMMQRVLICAAVLHNPDVLILDEPLSGLDERSTLLLRALIVALREKGTAVLYCSHTLRSVQGICANAVMLRKGQRVAFGAIEDLAAKENRDDHPENERTAPEQDTEYRDAAKQVVSAISRWSDR